MKSPTKQNQSEDRDQYENESSSLSSVSQMTAEMIANKAGKGVKSVKRPLQQTQAGPKEEEKVIYADEKSLIMADETIHHRFYNDAH